MVPRMPLLYLLVVLACVTVSYGDACTHPVYCTGPLLHAVQMAQVFNDSKTFVDMPMKYPAEQILALFSKQLSNTSTKYEIRTFVEQNFYPAGSDLVDVEPSDWVPNPTFIAQLNTTEMKAFGKGIHQKWKTLVRQWNNSFCDGCFSHLVVDRPFVIAGSRFREFYYWDTYWTMQGLLVSGMLNTTKGILLNFLELVKEIGFLPNGGRIYYLNRSQPPMLIQMVERYYAVTADIEFLEQALPILNMEYEYWMTNTTVEPEPGFILNRYYVVNSAPRPESYYEDVTLASTLPPEDREDLYEQLSTGAETGWDFSSRWMDNEPNLATLITNQIIPVDLNSILYKNEIVMSGFYQLVKQPVMQQLYEQRAQKRLAAIQALLWNNQTGVWNDRYLNGTFDTRYYGSIWYPFWAGAFGDLSSNQISAIIDNLTDILSYPGGVPVSILQTGQQWDFPNGWAPLQYLAISGLTTISNTASLDPSLRSQCAELAEQIVSRWLTSNFCAWNITGELYEKYDVTTRGIPGGGGEYTVQSGFGWTNGVALHLLQLYGNTFTLEACGQGAWVPYVPERMRHNNNQDNQDEL